MSTHTHTHTHTHTELGLLLGTHLLSFVSGLSLSDCDWHVSEGGGAAFVKKKGIWQKCYFWFTLIGSVTGWNHMETLCVCVFVCVCVARFKDLSMYVGLARAFDTRRRLRSTKKRPGAFHPRRRPYININTFLVSDRRKNGSQIIIHPSFPPFFFLYISLSAPWFRSLSACLSFFPPPPIRKQNKPPSLECLFYFLMMPAFECCEFTPTVSSWLGPGLFPLASDSPWWMA